MKPRSIHIVEEWRNAYRPGVCRSVALVVEAVDLETECIKLR